LSCDEYPNFSTYEGGPSAKRGLTVKPAAAVTAIDTAQNSAEGTAYCVFVRFKSGLFDRYTALIDAAKAKRFLLPGEGDQVAFLESRAKFAVLLLRILTHCPAKRFVVFCE
jgi:hypothetical protein